jgi:hypothetical protein
VRRCGDDSPGFLTRAFSIGDSSVARACAEVQKKFWDPPILEGARGNRSGASVQSTYSREKQNFSSLLEEQKAQTGSQRSRSSAWPSKTEQWQRGPRLGQRRSRSSAADRWLLRSARQLRAPPPRSAGFGRLKASAVSTSPGVAAVSIRIIEVRRPRHPLELRAHFFGAGKFFGQRFSTARRR